MLKAAQTSNPIHLQGSGSPRAEETKIEVLTDRRGAAHGIFPVGYGEEKTLSVTKKYWFGLHLKLNSKN